MFHIITIHHTIKRSEIAKKLEIITLVTTHFLGNQLIDLLGSDSELKKHEITDSLITFKGGCHCLCQYVLDYLTFCNLCRTRFCFNFCVLRRSPKFYPIPIFRSIWSDFQTWLLWDKWVHSKEWRCSITNRWLGFYAKQSIPKDE